MKKYCMVVLSKKVYQTLLSGFLLKLLKSSQKATKSVLAGGLHPKVKERALSSIKSYYKSLGRFVVDETKSSFLNSSVSTALNKANEKMINSMGW